MVSKLTLSERKDSARRAALGDFLRTRREKLNPTSVGLDGTGRRRTPGLRREEVAELAGVGVTWYTWLEQGRDIRASAKALAWISEALKLTAEERNHVFELAARADESSRQKEREPEKVPESITRLLENLQGIVAYVSGARLDILAWNPLANAVYGFSRIPPEDRNSLVILFARPGAAEMFPDATQIKLNLVATLRMHADADGSDESFAALVARLKSASAEFAKMWARHDVRRRKIGVKEIMHPKLGRLVFEHQAFQSLDAPSLRLVTYSPKDKKDDPENTKKKLRRLARE